MSSAEEITTEPAKGRLGLEALSFSFLSTLANSWSIWIFAVGYFIGTEKVILETFSVRTSFPPLILAEKFEFPPLLFH